MYTAMIGIPAGFLFVFEFHYVNPIKTRLLFFAISLLTRLRYEVHVNLVSQTC